VGGGVTSYISISGYLHLCNIDSETCYVRLFSLSFYKPQGIWNPYTACIQPVVGFEVVKIHVFWDWMLCLWLSIS
jgi:hypothetical protein